MDHGVGPHTGPWPEGAGWDGARVTELDGQPELVAAPVSVPGDPSLAGFPLVAALLVPGSRLTVRGVGLNLLRNGLLATLREMGGELAVTGERIEAGFEKGQVMAEAGVRLGKEAAVIGLGIEYRDAHDRRPPLSRPWGRRCPAPDGCAAP